MGVNKERRPLLDLSLQIIIKFQDKKENRKKSFFFFCYFFSFQCLSSNSNSNTEIIFSLADKALLQEKLSSSFFVLRAIKRR